MIDFDQSVEQRRIVIKANCDVELDDLKQKYNEMDDLLVRRSLIKPQFKLSLVQLS